MTAQVAGRLKSITNTFAATLRSSRILVSTCQNVYSNLAMEDWIYENVGFTDDISSIILIWRNRPCVVVGRHQNSWVECNIHRALDDEIDIARRRSGGGTVYHDLGNVNCTVFTNRNGYNRKRNLNVIANMFKDKWNLDVDVTPRDDLILDKQYKVSGTAAKLGGKVAYHHCTLLIKADLNNVRKYLHGIEHGVTSKATASVRSSIANLGDAKNDLTYSNLIERLSEAFRAAETYNTPDLWTYVDPTSENTFPGIHDFCSQLKRWDWIYGHTPKFQIQRTFECQVLGDLVQVSIDAEVEHGRLKTPQIQVLNCPTDIQDEASAICKQTASLLDGIKFWPSDVNNVKQSINGFCSENYKVTVLVKCLFDCLNNIAIGK